jgi:small neutral amino acid transporter SnatA (MarC family)
MDLSRGGVGTFLAPRRLFLRPNEFKMKVLLYLLAAVFGLFRALFRTAERLMSGAGISPVQAIIGIVGLLLAWLCVQKARASLA